MESAHGEGCTLLKRNCWQNLTLAKLRRGLTILGNVIAELADMDPTADETRSSELAKLPRISCAGEGWLKSPNVILGSTPLIAEVRRRRTRESGHVVDQIQGSLRLRVPSSIGGSM
jgi:hypothetical protein